MLLLSCREGDRNVRLEFVLLGTCGLPGHFYFLEWFPICRCVYGCSDGMCPRRFWNDSHPMDTPRLQSLQNLAVLGGGQFSIKAESCSGLLPKNSESVSMLLVSGTPQLDGGVTATSGCRLPSLLESVTNPRSWGKNEKTYVLQKPKRVSMRGGRFDMRGGA